MRWGLERGEKEQKPLSESLALLLMPPYFSSVFPIPVFLPSHTRHLLVLFVRVSKHLLPETQSRFWNKLSGPMACPQNCHFNWGDRCSGKACHRVISARKETTRDYRLVFLRRGSGKCLVGCGTSHQS